MFTKPRKFARFIDLKLSRHLTVLAYKLSKNTHERLRKDYRHEIDAYLTLYAIKKSLGLNPPAMSSNVRDVYEATKRTRKVMDHLRRIDIELWQLELQNTDSK
jgi:hypothetical protein